MSELVEDSLLVTVLIPTRNRARLLREVIEAIWKQDFPKDRFEIVVVDNISDDGTAEMMEDLIKRSPCSMRFHVMPVNKGPAHSRNTGAKIARGKILAFTDSDCAPETDWLAKGTKPFESDDVSFVTGPVFYKPGQPVSFFSRTVGELHDENITYPTANAFYRRSVFLEKGGFDEKLCFNDFFQRPVECADTDLAWRIKDEGGKNVFIRDMIVYHEVENMKPVAWAMEPFRNFVVPFLVRRHPTLRGQLLKWGVFFNPENIRFYPVLIGLVLGILVHPLFLLLGLPYVLWAARAGNPDLSIRRIPRIIARVILLSARQLVSCAGLFYGSLRFRTLVL